MNEYFSKPNSIGANVKVELDFSNYAIKTDLKNATGVVISDFAKKIDLADLKSHVDKLEIDKLKNMPRNLHNLERKANINQMFINRVDLSKLSDVVNNDVKKMFIILRSKVLKIKYLILLTQLLIVLLIIKQMKLKTNDLVLLT